MHPLLANQVHRHLPQPTRDSLSDFLAAVDDLCTRLDTASQACDKLHNPATCRLLIRNEALEARVAERTGDLQSANEQLLRDIAHRTLVEERLRRAEQNFRSIFENAAEGIFQTTADGHYLACNPALARIYGYDSPEDLIASITDIAHKLYVDDDSRPRFQKIMAQYGSVSGFEARIYRKDRSIIWITESARAVYDHDGKFLYYEGFVSDITSRKTAEEQLLRDAFHDSLTGLPNRALFLDRLERSMARITRDREHSFAVLFLDLDRFKGINDSLGHEVGDQLLLAFAKRLGACLRPADTAARLGGDEFVVLLDDPAAPHDPTGIAKRILEELNAPFRLGSHEVFITASIGIASSSTASSCPQDVLRDADTAMYSAKAKGKAGGGRSEVFDAAMHAHAVKLLKIENDLRRALDRGEFRLVYQPIVEIQSGRIKSFEALIRWSHPELGLVAPAEFIPLAEETGLILPIGRWVLFQACRQTALWHAQGASVDINVNLSGIQFSQPDLLDQVTQALQENGLPPQHLILEITESVVMHNPDAAVGALHRLKALGLKLNIDDFGTGYSSLAYLQQFPVDTMKIDRSFISRLAQPVLVALASDNQTAPVASARVPKTVPVALARVAPGTSGVATPQLLDTTTHAENAAEIVRTIIHLAHSLKMKVTAEGIETPQQLAFLQSLHCDHAQGYLISRPLDAHAAADLLDFPTPDHS